ncbi:uncharacterized protein [Vicugna pacos]|uniref:Uncharacterized protein n=1 Tax=Vicugna pacos TaxID=30538 RepID=A0ABM5DVN2_VICPA
MKGYRNKSGRKGRRGSWRTVEGRRDWTTQELTEDVVSYLHKDGSAQALLGDPLAERYLNLKIAFSEIVPPLSLTKHGGPRRVHSQGLELQLVSASSVALFSKGAPQTLAALGWTYFPDDPGCKLAFCLHGVAAGVSFSTVCLFSGFQAIKLKPRIRRWMELKLRSLKLIAFCCSLCWIAQTASRAPLQPQTLPETFARGQSHSHPPAPVSDVKIITETCQGAYRRGWVLSYHLIPPTKGDTLTAITVEMRITSQPRDEVIESPAFISRFRCPLPHLCRCHPGTHCPDSKCQPGKLFVPLLIKEAERKYRLELGVLKERLLIDTSVPLITGRWALETARPLYHDVMLENLVISLRLTSSKSNVVQLELGGEPCVLPFHHCISFYSNFQPWLIPHTPPDWSIPSLSSIGLHFMSLNTSSSQ